MSRPLRVLVVTIVHDPRDARIYHRQIASLLDAHHQVTYAAPFSAFGAAPPAGVVALDLPRSVDRDRVHAIRSARRTLQREVPRHDVVLLHDLELVASVEGITGPVIVWDVHEDTAAALTLKSWVPGPLRPLTSSAVRRFELRAERKYRLLLAEDGYRPLFRKQHPVVPNSTRSPETILPSGDERVVYVGSITEARGVREMVELGRLLADEPVSVEIIGHADTMSANLLRSAAERGWLIWHGFVPNDRALTMVAGATAGLSLLHDEANFRHSRPTKVLEYMAHGVPVITTPTPASRDVVRAADCGIVVGFQDAPAVAAAVRELVADPVRRQQLADNGRSAALRDHDWRRDGPEFVRLLETWASRGARV